MAGGIDWFRWHHGSVTDPKFLLVSRKSGASLPDVVAVWAYLLEKASAASERGTFGEVDAEAMDCLFNFPDTETRTANILAAMAERNLIGGGRVTAWEARQPKRERDPAPLPADAPAPLSSTERSRNHRAKLSQAEPPEGMQRHATPCNAAADHETPREEERREEKNSPSLRSGESAPKRAARKCPATFQLTEELITWAADKCPGVVLEDETAKFRDYTFGNAISDWPGAWRNWIRKAAEFAGRGRGGVAPAPPNKQQALENRNRSIGQQWANRQKEIADAD